MSHKTKTACPIGLKLLCTLVHIVKSQIFKFQPNRSNSFLFYGTFKPTYLGTTSFSFGECTMNIKGD